MKKEQSAKLPKSSKKKKNQAKVQKNRQKKGVRYLRKRKRWLAAIKKVHSEAPNPLVVEIRRAIHHHFPTLVDRLDTLPDLRKRKKYELSEILMASIMLFVFKEDSRNALNNDRKTEKFARNYKRIFGLDLPHMDTVNTVLKVLTPKELEDIKLWMLKTLLEKRVLHKYRLLNKYFCIAVDGTGYQKFDYEPYEGCPYREYKKSGKKVWFQPILEAKEWRKNNL